MSLISGYAVSDDECASPSTKRPIEDEDEEDVLRSMARRKKSLGPAIKEVQMCSDCGKTFKRPCDLTYGSSHSLREING